jgi:hypothetical protein
MARNKKTKSKQTSQKQTLSGEDRASLSLTVAWMLTAFATGIALVVVLIVQVLLWRFPPNTDGSKPFAAIPSLFLLIATVTGLLSLILMPVVYRVRRDPPPRSIGASVVIVCLLPLAIICWRALFA